MSSGDAPKPAGGSIRLKLSTREDARQSLARIIRLRAQGKMESDRFRDLCYGLAHLLGFFRLELDADVEKRLEILEERMEGFER